MSPAAREYFTCRGERLTEISFPLGGIGSGCIGLAGNGRLTDWEIFGRPNKGGNNGFSHFAVKAERNGQVSDARVLHGATLGSLMGSRKLVRFDHYGHGPSRYTMGGFPISRRSPSKGRS